MPLARDVDLTGGGLRGVTGPLQRIPLNAPTLYSSGTGASAVYDVSAGSMINRDGTSQRAVLNTPASIPSVAAVQDVVYGRVAGVRFSRTSTAAPFDFVVDGRVYPVDSSSVRRDNVAVSTMDFDSFFVLADGLDDRPEAHTVEAVLTGSAAAAKAIHIHGWIGEQGRGYAHATQPLRSGRDFMTTVPTAVTAVPSYGSPVAIRFFNSDTADRIVTLRSGGQIYERKTLPAGTGWTFTLDVPRTLATFTWQADAASVVNAWILVS
ncbi:hypothetical protein [Rhodococcoides kroppenstedtii]|uniref:hypothetical protein n=1 Tax=Rhodococcoides kroppenstedtii TaxID=293050 RepID=UPI001BDED11D|nr:hypothetical protein [Rhodococcus kroppenstedtii]MBT1191106.1 hypothetical protein [Rhodococcus kroppenstedtii]